MVTRDARNPAAAGGDLQPWEYARYLASVGPQVTYRTSPVPGAPREEVVEGVRVVRLGGVLSLWWRTFLHYVRHCRRRYDVVVEEGFGGSRIPRLAPLYVREPIVTEWHQVHRDLFAAQYPPPLRPLLNLLERATAYLHRRTLVRAGTPEWREAFPTIGFPRENIAVVPVSIPEAWLDGARPAPVAAPRVLWLGKFRRYKCPHHAVQAMAQVVRRVPGAQLTLAGRHDDRRYEARLRRLVRELGLEGSVAFHFDVPEEEKRALLEGSRALVLPSSVEGFGLVVLEANARGVPVVASSGVPEGAVRHEHNGLRYPFGDVDALAAALVRLLTDDALYARLSAASAAFAQGFAWRTVGAQFEALLLRAAGRGRGAA